MPSFTDAELFQKKIELKAMLVNVVDQFGSNNPGLPVHVLMGVLGEVLIQVSVSQSSAEHTMVLLGHLQDVVATNFSKGVDTARPG